METTIKHQHEGHSCWTPKLCAALNAVAELRTAAIRHDDHELSVRLDLIEETLRGDAPKSTRDDWLDDHDDGCECRNCMPMCDYGDRSTP